MKFPRGRRSLPLLVSALLLCVSVFAGDEAEDLRKRIPGGGMVYGELSCRTVQTSPLYARLTARYPVLRQLLDKGRGQLGGYDGELDRLVVMFGGDPNGFALLCQLSRPFDAEKLAAGLAAKGLQDKYKKITVGGRPGYVTGDADTAFGRTCVVLLSDRIMMLCPEKSAETMILGAKLPAELAGKLATGANGVFLRVIPGTAVLSPEAEIKNYEATGILNADASFSLEIKAEMPDEETAKTLELQVRQGLMLGIGMLFADDSELGMDLMNQVRIKRTGVALSARIALSSAMIERLVEFGVAQSEKREKEKAERQRRREERRRAAQRQREQPASSSSSSPAKPQQSAAPAASGTASSR